MTCGSATRCSGAAPHSHATEAVFSDAETISWRNGRHDVQATAYAGNLAQQLFQGNLVNTCSVLVRRAAVERSGRFATWLAAGVARTRIDTIKGGTVLFAHGPAPRTILTDPLLDDVK